MVECYSLHKMTIRPCDACDICRVTGVCMSITDEQIIYPRLQGADTIIRASAIYWYAKGAPIKLFIDRGNGMGCSQGHPLKGVPFV